MRLAIAAISPDHEPMAMRAKADEDDFLGGRMLIAMPGIDDPRFDRAVIMMCAHTPEHAMGIAVNRPLDGLTVPELLRRLGVEGDARLPDQPVMAGGPLERERGFVLHSDDYAAPDSTMPVAEGVALTVTREVLEAMGDRSRRPRRSLLALGHATWGSGQLEREIKESVWLIGDPDEAVIFDTDHETKWERALAKIGVRPSQLSAFSGRA